MFLDDIQPAHGIFPNLITPLDARGFPFLVFWPLAIDRTRLDIIWFATDWGEGEQPEDHQAIWALGGLALAFVLGWIIGGSLHTALTGLLWGGAVRMLVLHHVTYSINSLCHFFGRRQFETKDESRNLLWLAIPSFGESWHNNHHAFPTSFRHGMKPWELDISAGVIWLLEKTGLAWDVVRISPERQARKAVTPATP